MNMFGSLRARSPSPAMGSQPLQSRTAFASRADEEATPRQQPTIPARLTTATPLAPSTGDDSILSIASTSTTTSDGSLAPPLLPSKKGGSKRVLVPKKPLQPSNQSTSSAFGSATISASRPAAKSLRRPLNDENSYQPPSDWNVVPPPPPPRTVGNPHQFASARRIAPPVAAPIHAQARSKPEPVAILPVKTEDGSSSKNHDRARNSSIGASSVRTTTASVRSNGTIRTQKENTLRVYTDEPNSQDTPVLVKKKKSRLALDLGWALGDKTNGQTKEKDVNTPVSATSTRAATPTLKEKGSISRLSSILKSKSSTLRLSTGSSPDKENVDAKDKEKWKWSIGLSRGRKENTIKEVFGGRRPKSPEPAPPAIRNLSSFVSSAGPVEYEYRTPSLEDHPPNLAPPPPPVEKDPVPSIPPTIRSVSAPLTSITTLSDTLPRPVSVRIPSGPSVKHHQRTLSANALSDTLPRPVSVRIPSGPSARHHYRTFSADAAAILAPIESPVAMTRFEPDPDQTPVRRPASPTLLVRRGDDSPVSPTADTPKYNSDSLAIRAMRSVRSMARLFVSPEDEEKEKENKLKKRHSRLTLKGIGIEVFGNHERRPSNSSQESWVIGAPSSTEASPTTAVKAPVSGPVVDRPIVSASMRERMSTSIRPPSSEVEAPPRPSGETFGTMRMRKGRRSGSTRRTLSTASNFTAVSTGTSESSDSGYGAMPGSRNASYRVSSTGSGGRLSLFSALSSKSSQSNLNAKPADSLTEKTAKKRGSLANLFDLAASMASSGSSRSRRSSRVSKGSVESAGSRNSSGSDATSMATHDAHTTTARDRLEERIRTYQTLHTIPASPAPIQEEEDELSPPDLDTITNPQITRPSIPSFQPRTLTRNATVSYGPSGSKGKQADVTPQRGIRPKRRPASDHLLSSWAAERLEGAVSDEGGDVAILMVNAATSELGDLINHLDLAGTPDATPVKTATPRRARAFTTGDSPDPAFQDGGKQWGWSPLKGSNVSTAHLLMPTAPLSTAKSTFGRRLVRPELPIEQSPTEHITSSRRSSGTVRTMDDSDSIFDSPLKNRGRKQSGGSLLTNFGKTSTGTMLSLQGRSVGKGSTGTMLSAFGPSKGSSNVGNTTGDVSLTAFGHGGLDDSGVEEDEGETNNSDIPEELQEILSSHSEDYSLRSTETNGFCDFSIPGSTSALMASTHIESLLRRPSQTGNKSSVASIPPTSVPAIPLPAEPSLPRMSSNSSLSTTHLMDETKAASTIPRSSASNPSADSLNRLSTSALHDHSTSLDTLDEEDSLSASDEDITDHTGRSSFDFTKELNRLNEGGSRRSFVEQLANTWKGPSQPAGYRAPQEMPPLPSLDFLRQITHQDKKQSSSDDLPLAANPDSTMYAIANLDLSLVLSTDEPKKSGGPTKPVGRKVDHVRASSLSESLDASMAALTSLNLSVTNLSKPRPHSTSIESDVSKRHTRIAQARAYRRFQNLRERPLSAATTASFGSVVKPGASDPFNYGRPSSYMEASGDESSGEAADRRQNHTVTSIPSISSYGAVLNSGVKNPFGYDMTMDSESRSAFLSQSVEMPRGANPRYSVDSDRSSFYFDSNKYAMRGQRGDDSIVSARPRSNRPLSFRQRARPDSIMSTSSHAWGLGSQATQGSHTAWTKDQHDPARDSILSEFSFRRLSRPGLGDKMFESGPLYSIAGSPAQSSPPFMEFGRDEDDGRALRRSVDSADSRSVRFSVDSIFDKTGSNTSSISSPSVFGYDDSGISASDGLFAPGVKPQFRPLSMFSIASECESSRDDDTMISMLGGDHTKVPRGSLGNEVNSSPCVRAEKKRRAFWRLRKDDSNEASQLSGLSMSSADNSQEQSANDGNSSLGLPSFEESDKSGATEASVSTQEHSHIFDRPFSALVNPSWDDLNAMAHQSGSRSSRAGQPPTPPLSYASSADGSQSSIDVEKLKMLLESSAPPSFNPDRLRPTGKGHRRRSHMSEMSRISMIESIAEEVTSESGSPRAPKFEHLPEPSIVVWDTQSRRSSWRESVDWESEFGVMLRQYYSLQTEAHETVQESQNLWLDTDFSRFALATFNPPRNPAGIQALLEHSQKTFVPLPLELCVRQPRSRANSRPSPYPRGPAKTISGQPFRRHGRTPSVESAINCISPFSHPLSSSTTEPIVSPTLATLAPLSPFSVNFQSAAESLPHENLQPIPSLCSAIESDAKRNVLGRRVGKPTDKTNAKNTNGWTFGKKSQEMLANKSASKSQIIANSSATAKENREREAQGTLTRNTTLRISRARPPRRPTAASVLAPNTLRV